MYVTVHMQTELYSRQSFFQESKDLHNKLEVGLLSNSCKTVHMHIDVQLDLTLSVLSVAGTLSYSHSQTVYIACL